MTRRQLPIGIQDFRTIREQDCYYVDKTPHIRRLVEEGRHWFLSRPRRFGKSLLIDTLRELFEGNEPLFRGLDIHGHWDWSAKHPVVRLSFGGKYNEAGDLEDDIKSQLAIIERNAGLDSAQVPRTAPARLRDLLDRLHHATGQQVVVLVDEYDKPILDVIDQPEMATANRDYLRGFYGIIKDSARDVRFTFVTGVSMFSRVSLFSGLNNLRNISLDPNYASICGYTDSDEAWYAGMLYACFRTIGLDLRVEDASGRGRADMVALHGGQVFVFEFKMAETERDGDSATEQAIGQMRDKGYAEKYRDRGEPIHLVGLAFSREGRNLTAVKAVPA